jgi:hypothetical protein
VDQRFNKHYTHDEARALLPQIRGWLKRLQRLRRELIAKDKLLSELLKNGDSLGGPEVNNWVRVLAEIKEILFEFYQREIQIKDLDRGLIDFPAFIGGKEVFLCWEQKESDIGFWHDLDAGYAGREPLSGLE